MRLLRPNSLRIRSTLRSPLSNNRSRKEPQRAKDKAPRTRHTPHSPTSSTTTSHDTSARTLQNILSFRPTKHRARSEISTEAISSDETPDDPTPLPKTPQNKYQPSSAQLERKVDVLQDEVDRLRDQVAQHREEVEKVTRERNEYRRRVRQVDDEEGSGSTVQTVKRQMERLRWCAAWHKLRSVKLQRQVAVASRGDATELGEGDDETQWDDLVGETVMAAIEHHGAGTGVHDWNDAETDDGGRSDWRDHEIEKLEELLKEEYGMRMELEGMVEEMTEALHRRDEEERRASEYLEARWKRAEQDLRDVLQSADGKRHGWGDDTRRVTTAVDGSDHFWM